MDGLNKELLVQTQKGRIQRVKAGMGNLRRIQKHCLSIHG